MTAILPTTSPETASKRPLSFRSPGSNWSNGKTSIATATVIGIITFAALLFLAIWYIRRERRARRLLQIRNANQDPCCQSSLSLAEDTSKVLDEFLMKDIEPERTSLMFSRSRSPSMAFVVDNVEARNSTTRFYRTSYEASTHSLTQLDSLTRVSTDGTRPSLIVSETSRPQFNIAAQASSSITPRASVGSAKTPSPRSSQLYPTISATTNATNTTEISSIFSQGPPTSSRTSTSAVRSANIPSSSNSSMPPPSTTSRTSSQLSRSSPRHSGGRVPNDGDSVRKGQVRSHRLSQSTVVSPVEESLVSTESPQLPSIPPTPSPLFRFSEA